MTRNTLFGMTVTVTLVAVILVACAPTAQTSTSPRATAQSAAPVSVPAISASVPAASPAAASQLAIARGVLPASAPLRIQIPSIDVDSDLMDLGLTDDGALEVPTSAFPAGWFTGGPTPGELGPAVIAGHIDWVTGPGVFLRLGEVAVGDEVRVPRADNTVAVFRVVNVGQYPKDEFPTSLVYGNISKAGLRVISCGGDFNRGTGHYEDNIVVFAELVT